MDKKLEKEMLSDAELSGVSGGVYDARPQPKYKVGEKVMYEGTFAQDGPVLATVEFWDAVKTEVSYSILMIEANRAVVNVPESRLRPVTIAHETGACGGW